MKPRLHRSNLPPPPQNWKQLEKHEHMEGFKAAIEKEIRDLENYETWEVVETPISQKPLPLKWVFTYKFNTDGYLEKYKARIYVRGDLQPWSDKDNYVATLTAKIIRSLIVITAIFDLEAVQLDVVNAFANSLLDELIYCICPNGFRIPGQLIRL